MPQNPCAISECPRPRRIKDWCTYHGYRAKTYGDPLHPGTGRGSYQGTPLERFERKVDKNGPIIYPHLGPCEVWTALRSRAGYGKFKFGKEQLATRSAWILYVGPIPDGMNLLHKCDNPPCVRIDHLFLGTIADNSKDMVSKGRHAGQLRTHCPKGHPYDEANTYVHPRRGTRACKQCVREASLANYYRKKALAAEAAIKAA